MSARLTASIITIDRSPKENYLPGTLENLRRSGFLLSPLVRSVHVVDGGSSPEHVEATVALAGRYGAVVHSAERRFLPCENAGRALGISTAAAYADDWILFLEDDIDACADFAGSIVRWLDTVASPHYRVYVFGAAYPQVDRRGKAAGSWSYPIEKFYGTQALALRRDDAADLGAYWRSNPRVSGDYSPGAYDLMLHAWHRKRFPGVKHLLASAPSFIQHTGRASMCTGLERTHEFGSWLGPEWRFA